MIASYGEDTVAAFIAEPVAGATLGAAVPRRHGRRSRGVPAHDVVLIADEVMTGFGRTGSWFAIEHWDVQPDLLTAGKGHERLRPVRVRGGVGPGWPSDRVRAGFVHGFTWSHNALGAAAGLASS